MKGAFVGKKGIVTFDEIYLCIKITFYSALCFRCGFSV